MTAEQSMVPGFLGRVLDADGSPLGTCFQVGGSVLVTAWHVLVDADADTVGATVLVDSLAAGWAGPAPTEVVAGDAVHDLAVLMRQTPLPDAESRLAASGAQDIGVGVVITGHGLLDDPGKAALRHADAPGEWAGGVMRDDAVSLARVTSRDVLRGMSGAPVRRRTDGVIVGVVSARYNSADGWFRDSVWVARIEDLYLLLAQVPGWAPRQILDAHGRSADRPSVQNASNHWSLKGRGLFSNFDQGSWFRGRTAALTQIVEWLGGGVDSGELLVVTGSPGSGKSALLGRLVTTADPSITESLPEWDHGVRAAIGSITCAVHAKGKTALEVGAEIARSISAETPDQLDDFLPAMSEALMQRPTTNAFTLVIDALDECIDPEDARSIASDILTPLAEKRTAPRVKVLVGTRSRDSEGSLIDTFAKSTRVIDLDSPDYFSRDDLTGYCLDTLRAKSDETAQSPYHDFSVALPIARRIAELAGTNFLVGGLVARSHGLYDTVPVDPNEVEFSSNVDSALRSYLRGVAPVSGFRAEQILIGLASAGAPGLTIGLWQLALKAVQNIEIDYDALIDFAHGAAANFLLSAHAGAEIAYQLFHQALSDSLLAGRVSKGHRRQEDERRWVLALLNRARERGWASADSYILRNLPAHSNQAKLVDTLYCDDEVLLSVDLSRLLSVSSGCTTSLGQRRARLVRLTPSAISSSRNSRIAAFSVTELLEGLGSSFAEHPSSISMYRAVWAASRGRAEITVLEGHEGWVWAVSAGRVGDRPMIASSSDDGKLNIWSADNFSLIRSIETWRLCHAAALEIIKVGGRSVIVLGEYGHLTAWDIVSGAAESSPAFEDPGAAALCVTSIGGREALAVGYYSGHIRIWDTETWAMTRELLSDPRQVLTLAALDLDGRVGLASAGVGGRIRVWDVESDQPARILKKHRGRVLALRSGSIYGRTVLVSGGADRILRIWDPVAGTLDREIKQANWVGGIALFGTPESPLIACTNGDDIDFWDPTTGANLGRHSNIGVYRAYQPVCPIPTDEGISVATADIRGTVRLWDKSSTQHAGAEGGYVSSMCEGIVAGVPIVAACSSSTITLRNTDDGGFKGEIKLGPTDGWRKKIAMCGDLLVCTADKNRTLELRDMQSGLLSRKLFGHTNAMTTLCSFELTGLGWMLASGGYDKSVRVWDPSGRRRPHILDGHSGTVDSICAVEYDGHQGLASAGRDGSIRLWDPVVGRVGRRLRRPQHRVSELCSVVLEGRTMLVGGTSKGALQFWDTGSDKSWLVGTAYNNVVVAICALNARGVDLIALASYDRSVCIFDPVQESVVCTIPVHHRPNCLIAPGDGRLIVGTEAGIIALDLNTRPDSVHWTGC